VPRFDEFRGKLSKNGKCPEVKLAKEPL